jgi:putative hydrolase of the HAD superfamily
LAIKTEGIRAIVFDLDRTLIKSQRGSDKALIEAADFFHKRYGNRVSRRKINRTLRRLAKSLESQGLYNRDEWWIKLSRRLGLSNLSSNWAHKITLLYWRTYVAASLPYEDAEYTLKTLRKRGYRSALVTDTDGTLGMKRKRVRTLPFYDLFETVVVAGEDTPKIKPSKMPFILVAERLKLSPTKCVYVGDNPRVDVRGAKAVGTQTILVRRRSLKGDRPTLVIKSLSQLLRIFSGLDR